MKRLPVDQDGPAADVIRGLWKELPDLAGMVLGCDVSCKSPVLEDQFSPPERAYVARLESEDGSASGWVIFELQAAIAAAGLLVMRQEPTIKKRLDSGEFEGDDFDAMGEFVNQIVPSINDALKKGPGDAPHFIFKEGSIERDALPEPAGMVAGHGKVSIGGLADGVLMLVVPQAVLGVEITEEAVSDGLELSAEELAAIREATREAVGTTRTLLVVPLQRERESWSELLSEVGLDVEFVGDVAGLRRQLSVGDVGVVVIDADACPAGGLPMLAALRRDEGSVAGLIVASSPTRSHLLSCMAAGARSYLTKPIDPQSLVESVGRLS